MSKKSKESTALRFSLRSLIPFVLIALIGACGWWLWQDHSSLKEAVYQYVENQEILTLESRFTPEQIMELHRQELLGAGKKSYREPIYKYSPYLLLEVKYIEDKKSREGVVLWSLENGEIVLNTENWEVTHGFKDCLDCNASRNDFKILQTLAKQQGSLSLDELQKELQVEKEILDDWVESARTKHLVVQKQHLVQLHFENPRILIFPNTTIKDQLVSKPISSHQRVAKKYNRSQIMKVAQAAFGQDFKIRQEHEVFLPVYTLEVLNPDGSVHASDWNAITGQQMIPSYLSNHS